MIAEIKAVILQAIAVQYPTMVLFEEILPENARSPACLLQLHRQELKRRIGGGYAVTAYFTLTYQPETAADPNDRIQMQMNLMRLLTAIKTCQIHAISGLLENNSKNSMVTFQASYLEQAEKDQIPMNQMLFNSHTE